MTMHRVAKCLENSISPQDCPQLGRPQAIKRETIKKAFENNLTLKMTKSAQRKKILVSTVSRAIKNGRGKSLRLLKKPLLSRLMIQKHLERNICLLNDLKNHKNRILIFTDEKTFTVDPVFNKQNNCILTFGKDISEICKVSTKKHPASVMMLGVVASNGEKMLPVWQCQIFHGMCVRVLILQFFWLPLLSIYNLDTFW